MRAEKLVERESNETEDHSLIVPMKGLSWYSLRHEWSRNCSDVFLLW